jgi:SAM-dependent methyltransferase
VAFDHDFLGHRISRCAACGTCLMNPQHSDAALADYYASYITEETPERKAWRRAQKERRFDLLTRYVTSGRCLCVGCGDGLELVIARERGLAPEGYDVDADTVSDVARDTGVVVRTGDFLALDVPAGSYDCLYMDQVIEHPKNPGDYLKQAHALLKPGGILYMGLPNIGSLSNRYKTLIGKLGLKNRSRGKHYATTHHLSYFAPGQFSRLLRDHYGFRIRQVSGDPSPKAGRWKTWCERRFPVLGSTFVVIGEKNK